VLVFEGVFDENAVFFEDLFGGGEVEGGFGVEEEDFEPDCFEFGAGEGDILVVDLLFYL